MCGIFGWITSNRRNKFFARNIADNVMKAMRHRGPDDYGYLIVSAIQNQCYNETSADAPEHFKLLLGQVRLSIIDLSPLGHQPFFSQNGRYVMVYNGEIYNYIELRRELEAQGVVFRTHGDTEVVMQSLIFWGVAALSRFTGMFAIAFYDFFTNKFLCARDCFGIKPFLWHYGSMGFCFASEIGALLEFPEINRSLSPNEVYMYLWAGESNHGEKTMFKNIFYLPPAHYMEIDLDSLDMPQPVRYWKPELGKKNNIGYMDAAEELRRLFLDSVQMHMRADVPLGVALSGGVDSSAVTCAMRYVEPDINLHAFSFIAKGTSVSEEIWADMVAEEARAIRHVVDVHPNELMDDVDTLIYHLGEPFGSTSIYAQYRVFKLAKESGIKVTLDGQGADELLAGYLGYPGQRLASLIRNGQLFRAFRFFNKSSLLPSRNKKKLFMHALWQFIPWPFAVFSHALAGQSTAPAWIDKLLLEQVSLDNDVFCGNLREMNMLFPTSNKVLQVLAYQLVWNGLPALLRHGDRNAMAHSIESRVPFLTKDIADFCLSLPEEYLIDMSGQTKSVFRQAMRGLVPDAVLDRKDKIGFATPEEGWLKNLAPWVDDILVSATDIPFINLSEMQREWQYMRSGQLGFNRRVWRWLNYIRWIQIFKVTM